MPLWEERATLVTVMLLGHWIEMRSVSVIPITELGEGDVVLARPGASQGQWSV